MKETLLKQSVTVLRALSRRVIPDIACGLQGLAATGTKEQLINAILENVPIETINYFLNASEKNNDNGKKENENKRNESGNGGTEHHETNKLPSNTGGTPPLNNAQELSQLETIRRIIGGGGGSVDTRKVAEIVNQQIDRKINELEKSKKEIVIKNISNETKKHINKQHKEFPNILTCVNADINLLLVGPAGSGKTSVCQAVADALDLHFYALSLGPQTSKGDLFGFIDAVGHYQTTPLRQAFEGGGVLCLDELDAAAPGVLTGINSLLSNGFCSFPDKEIKKHENFRCICTANTYGNGGDRLYVGRTQLDAATLDRFAVINFGYDEELERNYSDNVEWVKLVQRYRRNANNLRLRVVISPRAVINGAKMLKAGLPLEMVENACIFKGCDALTRQKIKGQN